MLGVMNVAMINSPHYFLVRFLVIALLPTLLSVCATPQDARNKGPVASFVSRKSAKEVTACVATSWESAYWITNPVNVRPTPEGYTLQISNGQGNTFVVLDVNDVKDAAGSKSTYYKGYVLGESRWDIAVAECQ